MAKDITIKKGLDIRLKGSPEKTVTSSPRSRTFAIKPSDFHLIIPKMVVKEGEKLNAGDDIFYSRGNENLRFVSPVSGTLKEIKRGPKRVITDIIIEADSQDSYREFGTLDIASASADAVKSRLMESGCWAFIKQRPYDIIAEADSNPKAIFISAYATAPLAADYDFVLRGKEKEIQTAINALSKVAGCKVYVGVSKKGNSPMKSIQGIDFVNISGPHPAGNVSTIINRIDPINKGEIVWTITPQDLIIIGELLLTGRFNAERTVALSGSSVKKPMYFKTKIGAEVSTVVYASGIDNENVRAINGDVLTGKKVALDGYIGYYNNTITVIPEGNDYELFGWNKPVFNKISVTRALTFSWLQPKKEYELNTNTNGEHRAFVQTGIYEQVFPFDMYPLQMLKACVINDLDNMEVLGMYEIAPEDFALTEFVCISKQPHQEIIREGLDLMYKEL